MFKAPNIKGPRFRKDFKEVLCKKLYWKYLEAHPEHSTLTFEKFKQIITTHSGKMWETAVNDRDGIELPIGGSVFVGSTKIRKKNNYDIQASIKANRPVKHRNYETDGHVAKIYYSPYLSKVGGRDRSIWAFKGSRQFTRSVSKVYPKQWNKYIMITDLHGVIREYKKHSYRNFMVASTEKTTKTYNEFDLN